MSEKSQAFRRQRERDAVASFKADDEARAKSRHTRLKKLPGYQALLQDPEWDALEKQYREIIARFKDKLAWVGQRSRDELTAEEQARADKLHMEREKALMPWRQRASELQHDYGLGASGEGKGASESPENASPAIKAAYKTHESGPKLDTPSKLLAWVQFQRGPARIMDESIGFTPMSDEEILELAKLFASDDGCKPSLKTEIPTLGELEVWCKDPASGERAKQPSNIAASEPLTKRAELVYREIVKDGPLKGPEIIRRTGIDQSTLTSEVIPELKRLRGILNKRGAGYYSPAHFSAKTPQ